LPFLLAARAQSIVALAGIHEHQATRAYFAEGLASSFEAFADTRRGRTTEIDDQPEAATTDESAEIRWYVDRISAALPEDDAGSWSEHPKIRATTDAALRLWRTGEKVLIFCFYRATGRALRSHISRAMLADIVDQGANRLQLETTDETAVLEALDQWAASMLREGSPGTRVIERRVSKICSRFDLSPADTSQIVDVVTRFMRTASFLVRFVDLNTRRSANAIEAAFSRTDGSGATLESRIAAFAEMVDRLTETERGNLWASLTGIQTGSIQVAASGHFDPGEVGVRRETTLPNVRLANGVVRQETRQRLMRTFNTPFFPEVLVASSVMAEGVDLHLDCRHVIHHDLDWNPSTLEQRTGRLDRLGSKAERDGTMIMVYEPYMAGTQDEKMFRVVKDRDRWFSVLMGGQQDTSEWSTDKIAERVPVPSAILDELTINLTVSRD
jgi:ERCC4-related helicase